MRLLPLAALLFLAACGQQLGPTAADAVSPTVAVTTSSSTATSSPSPSGTTTSTSPTSPTPSSRPAAHRPSGIRGALLTASELPRLLGVTSWRVEHTGRESDPIGACQVTSLQTIGATSALVRTYSASSGAAAIQVVGQFADAKSAWRAHEVLKSWRSQCASRVGGGATVTALGTVEVAPATGHRYVVDTKHQIFEGVGILRRGDRLSLVVYVAHGSSYAWPAGRDPETRALKLISPLLT